MLRLLPAVALAASLGCAHTTPDDAIERGRAHVAQVKVAAGLMLVALGEAEAACEARPEAPGCDKVLPLRERIEELRAALDDAEDALGAASDVWAQLQPLVSEIEALRTK